MATLPVWLLGRNCQTTITPGSIDQTTGNFVPGATRSLAGTLESVSVSSKVTDTNISPMDYNEANHVAEEYDTSIRLVEILKANALNILPFCSFNYTHAYITFQRGIQTYSGHFLLGDLTDGATKGKSTAELTVSQVTLAGNAANVIYG
jgi:hypothetical protein